MSLDCFSAYALTALTSGCRLLPTVPCTTFNLLKRQEILHGALTHAGIECGIFITLRGYAGEAKQLAAKHAIQIINESDLTKLLDDAHARFDPDLVAVLSDTRKFCPKCEAEMVLRTAKKGFNEGGHFWGCSRFPKCRYKMEASL